MLTVSAYTLDGPAVPFANRLLTNVPAGIVCAEPPLNKTVPVALLSVVLIPPVLFIVIVPPKVNVNPVPTVILPVLFIFREVVTVAAVATLTAVL